MLVRLKETLFLALYFLFVPTTRGQRFEIFPRQTFFGDDDFTNENVHFFGPPTDAFWRQFWDVFNYKGPSQENSFSRPLQTSGVGPVLKSLDRPGFGPVLRPVERPPARPYFPEYGYEEQYLGSDYFVPRRENVTPGRRQPVSGGSEDEYNRYRDYFYRRYGNNFLD